jgi:hypothetical protein
MGIGQFGDSQNVGHEFSCEADGTRADHGDFYGHREILLNYDL